ncbi:hypothetical protein ACRALDRAFT_1069037 [Sodiomyces alcalophilus JCM 7366]|uniref:uncharacterized protein n=1 Tax=Sodiomyces alcalophilus JCM 7366 TaxID=591952 RepID=UPI0039B6BCF0
MPQHPGKTRDSDEIAAGPSNWWRRRAFAQSHEVVLGLTPEQKRLAESNSSNEIAPAPRPDKGKGKDVEPAKEDDSIPMIPDEEQREEAVASHERTPASRSSSGRGKGVVFAALDDMIPAPPDQKQDKDANNSGEMDLSSRLVTGEGSAAAGPSETTAAVPDQGQRDEAANSNEMTPSSRLDRTEAAVVQHVETVSAPGRRQRRDEESDPDEITPAPRPPKGKGKGKEKAVDPDEITPAPPLIQGQNEDVDAASVNTTSSRRGHKRKRSRAAAEEKPHPAPRQVHPSELVHLNNSGQRGRGVFSRYRVHQDHVIFTEIPLLECRQVDLLNSRGFSYAWEMATPATRHQLGRMFPWLAELPRFLDYDKATRLKLEKFLRDRAFATVKVAGTGRMCVVGGYASLINHACPGEDSQVNARISPLSPLGARFVVKAAREIQPGEEIFIDYGRTLGFRCCCRVCENVRNNRLGGRIALWAKRQWDKRKWDWQWKKGKWKDTVWYPPL